MKWSISQEIVTSYHEFLLQLEWKLKFRQQHEITGKIFNLKMTGKGEKLQLEEMKSCREHTSHRGQPSPLTQEVRVSREGILA